MWLAGSISDIGEVQAYSRFACIIETKEKEFCMLIREAEGGQYVPDYARLCYQSLLHRRTLLDRLRLTPIEDPHDFESARRFAMQ